jgi:hypothetical protein
MKRRAARRRGSFGQWTTDDGMGGAGRTENGRDAADQNNLRNPAWWQAQNADEPPCHGIDTMPSPKEKRRRARGGRFR